jgi:hypothetical protein
VNLKQGEQADNDEEELPHLAHKREKEIMNRISNKFEQTDGSIKLRDG